MYYFIQTAFPFFVTFWLLPAIIIFLILKFSPVAMNAFKDTVRQPYFIVIVSICLFVIIVVANLPLFALGDQHDQVRMVRDMGLTTSTLCGLIVVLFSASTSVTEEIEKKTAMTVLSKPVTRGRFIVGKYLGILATSALAVGLVGFLTILIINYFTIIPLQGEHLSTRDPIKRSAVLNRLLLARIENFSLMTHGIFLAFLQISVIGAISVAIATRAGTVFNVVLCSLVYIVGHIGNWIHSLITKASDLAASSGTVSVLGRTFGETVWKIFYAIIPNLENFNATLSLGTGITFECRLIDSIKYSYMMPKLLEILIPPIPDFILANILYALVYIVAALIVAIILFRTREVG